MDLDRIEARVAQLEQRCSRQTLAISLLVISVLGLGLLGAMARRAATKDEIPELIRARQFQVVDSSGEPRLRLYSNSNQTALTLRDQGGIPKVKLSLDLEGVNGPYLSLRQGGESLCLYPDRIYGDDDEGHSTWIDSSGSIRVSSKSSMLDLAPQQLSIGPTGSRPSHALLTTAEGTGRLVLSSSDEEILVELPSR